MIFTSFSLALIRKDENSEYNCPLNENKKLDSESFSVDVFVCTYNESLDILRDTLIGCINMSYSNKKVYVLDDGRRPEVAQLAADLGCNYITRPQNKGFKAGNINNAIRQTNSDLIVIFDADHVPVSTFLNELVVYFKEEKVALLQTPQHFFNPDPFQKNLSLEKHISNEQDLFYRVIEPGLANYGAAVCCGTNFVLRRKYVEEVGGFPENTITEDSALGIMLETKGYKILYYNKPLAAGRAPETFSEYLKQRARWAKGNIQIFLNFSNLMSMFKLRLVQIFFHFNGMLYFLYCFPRMIFLLSPVLYLLFGVMPVAAVVWQIIAFQSIYFIMKIGYSYTTCKKYRHALITDVYESATALFLCIDIIKMLLTPGQIKKQKFSVTEKGDKAYKPVEFKYFFPVFMLTAILFAAMIKGINDLYTGADNPGATFVNIYWNLYNLIIMVYAVRVVVEKPELRRSIRIPTNINTKIINDIGLSLSVDILNLSKGGALIHLVNLSENMNYLDEFLSREIKLLMPNGCGVESEVIRVSKQSDKVYLQIRFLEDYTTLKDPS